MITAQEAFDAFEQLAKAMCVESLSVSKPKPVDRCAYCAKPVEKCGCGASTK